MVCEVKFGAKILPVHSLLTLKLRSWATVSLFHKFDVTDQGDEENGTC